MGASLIPEDEWIGAASALTMLKPVMGASTAQRAICTRAHDGLVRTRAQRYFQGNTAKDDYEVPKAFWWAGGEAALKQNWVTGDFETWINHQHHLRAYGVSFFRADLERMLPDNLGLVVPSPEVPPHVVAYEPLRGRRQYLENLARQINGCYQLGYYDGCAVMSRRLMECLLILAFNEQGHAQTILNPSGDPQPLAELISLAASGQYIRLARGSGAVLSKVKELGDRAAHHPTYNTRRQDIDNLSVGYAALISELAHLADVSA